MPYGSNNDSVTRIDSDNILRDNAFKIASNPRYDGYEREVALMVYKFFWYEICYYAHIVVVLCQINNFQMSFINQSLQNSKDAKSILLFKTISGLMILLTCG